MLAEIELSLSDLWCSIKHWKFFTNGRKNIRLYDLIRNAIHTTGKSFMETKCALQSSVYDAGRWFDNNNVSINITKTKCMLIATEGNLNRVAQEERKLSLELSGITLEQVQNTPYLGPQLDDKLPWETHVQKLCRNVSSKLAVLNRLRKVLNKNYFANSISHAYNLALIMPFLSGVHAQSKPET